MSRDRQKAEKKRRISDPIAGAVGFYGGCLLLVLVWYLTFQARHLSWTHHNWLLIHQDAPALWLLFLLPSTSGLLFFRFNQLHLRQQRLQGQLDQSHSAPAIESLAQLLYQKSMEAILIVDSRGLITRANHTSETLFGYEQEELIGLIIEQLVPDHAKRSEAKSTSRKTSKGALLGTEWHMLGRHKDGDTFPIELSYLPGSGPLKRSHIYLIRDPSGVVANLRRGNLFLQQTRDQAREDARVREKFITRVAQELRTPLTTVQGYTEILIEDAEEVGLHDALGDLKRIQRGCQHLGAVIRNVLEIARFDDNFSDPFCEKIEVQTIVQELEMTFKRRAHLKGNVLSCQIIDSSVQNAWADPTFLRQILIGLMDNACEHTENGSVALHVKREPAPHGHWVFFQVLDTGDGISEETLQTLFDAPDTPLTSRFTERGSSPALPLCQRMAHLMDGKILVKSTLSKGSSFSVRLPEQKML